MINITEIRVKFKMNFQLSLIMNKFTNLNFNFKMKQKIKQSNHITIMTQKDKLEVSQKIRKS